MKQNILAFEPRYKTVIWGGERIAPYKGVNIAESCVGESWELSAVEGHESVVAHGELAGENLVELCRRYGAELLGRSVVERYGSTFPLLIKLIDARQDLSVQVHPDDAMAQSRHGSQGKTEMWYVVDRTPGARIYCGLSAPLTPEGYVERVSHNTIMDVVAAHAAEPGQFYYIPAGTIHAIGAGNLIAEIQQSSDITYRVYDYDRRDAQGHARELHTMQARDAIDYRFPHSVSPTAQSYSGLQQNAVVSPYFTVDLVSDGATLEANPAGQAFAIVMATRGSATVEFADGSRHTVSQGSTVLIPASAPAYALRSDVGCAALHVKP
jgi:mannose-6-phosphate isomerase